MRKNSEFIPFNTDPITDSRLSWTEKGVFIELNSWADDNGICSITYEQFKSKVPDDEKEESQFSEKGFTQSFKRLEDYGYINLIGVVKSSTYVVYVCGYEEQLAFLKDE